MIILYMCCVIGFVFTMQILDFTSKLASRDAEFEGYRQQVLSKPESKLQAELTMLHLEKVSMFDLW